MPASAAQPGYLGEGAVRRVSPRTTASLARDATSHCPDGAFKRGRLASLALYHTYPFPPEPAVGETVHVISFL